MFYNKVPKYQMNMDVANTALQNILNTCNQSPNTIPFDKLILRQKLNTRIYDRILLIISILLFLTFASPLIVVPVSTLAENIFVAKPVEILGNYVEDDTIYFELTGDNILYHDAYMITESGEQYSALSYDQKEQIICFPYFTNQEINFFIPVKNDTTIHLLLSPTQ